MAKQVLSAKQLLAVLRREPGHETIAAKLYGSRISTLSMAFVLAECGRAGLEIEQSKQAIAKLQLSVVPLHEEQAARIAFSLLVSADGPFDLEPLACATILAK